MIHRLADRGRHLYRVLLLNDPTLGSARGHEDPTNETSRIPDHRGANPNARGRTLGLHIETERPTGGGGGERSAKSRRVLGPSARPRRKPPERSLPRLKWARDDSSTRQSAPRC